MSTETLPTEQDVGRIHVQHASARGKLLGPHIGYGAQEVTREQLEALERVAVTTFADMVSAGHTFQSALAAVYYSGVVHALEIIDEH